MSRVGLAPINIPQGVEVSFNDGVVTVKGPKGELTQAIDSCITMKQEEGVINLERASDAKDHRAKHGLSRALINNMVVGVSEGYKIEQELHGVGYRANNKGQILELLLGYSHPIHFMIPDEVKLTTEMEKGQPPKIILESHDKQLIGHIAAKIRSFRKPEPFKGKGIRYKGEEIRRKAGKSAASA